MKRISILVVGIMLVATACTSGNGGGENGAASQPPGGGSSGDVINPQPPGQASVSVDGVEHTFEGEILIVCSIGDGFNYTFSAEGGKVMLAAGGHDSGEAGWGGSITFTMTDDEPDPDSGETGFVKYVVHLPDVDSSTMAFDGDSMSFRGPMLKQTSGSAPPGEDAGTGTVSVTCP